MILRKGAKSFTKPSQLQRRFCAKDYLQKATFKPLILYTAGIAVVGALAGSYYTKMVISKKSPQENEQVKAEEGDLTAKSEEQVKEKREDTKVEQQSEDNQEELKKKEAEHDKLIQELFGSARLPVPLIELGDQDLTEDRDGLLLLVPPLLDRELFERVSSMIGNLETLHHLANSQKKDGEPLRAFYVKISGLENLKQIGDRLGVPLTTNDDVPLIVIRNKFLEKPQVVTLMDLLQKEEVFYNSFRPLKEVTKTNTAKFEKVLKDLLADEVVLFEYADPTRKDFKSLRSQFYAKTLQERMTTTKALEQVFVQSTDWLPESAGVQLEHGGVYLLQKDGARVLSTAPKIALPASDDQFLLYKVAQEEAGQPLDLRELIRAAGSQYYEHNLAVNPDLVPKTSEYSLVFKYDLNKLVDTQLDAAVEVVKEVREQLNKKGQSQEQLRILMIPYSFSPSEGKVDSLTLRQNLKSERRLKYLFHIKTKEEMKEMLAKHPDVASNDALELQFPEDFGFGTDYILKFIELGLNGQINDSIQSEQEPRYERFSRKLTGDNFVEKVKDNTLEQIIFLYSTTCASCKKFTPLFEKLALQNIQKGFMLTGKEGIFNRLNKDHNDIRGDKNYDSTPVFLYYRGDYKSAPYLYKQSYLTESSLKEFVTLTCQFGLLSEQTLSLLAKRPRKAVAELFN